MYPCHRPLGSRLEATWTTERTKAPGVGVRGPSRGADAPASHGDRTTLERRRARHADAIACEPSVCAAPPQAAEGTIQTLGPWNDRSPPDGRSSEGLCRVVPAKETWVESTHPGGR